MEQLRNKTRILRHLYDTVSLLKNQSGWDEETMLADNLLQQIIRKLNGLGVP